MEGNFKKWINRINAKQDVLTEDNVGEFMDLELATKSTPTSGDTVLARDSLTGKAVEIPTSSFGGSGGGSGLVLGETSSTAYRGDKGKIAYDHSQITHDKNLVGLGNVDNTSDLNKPISTATQTALNGKQTNLGFTPENVANKSDSYTSNSSTTYASSKALVDGLATKLDKGTYTGNASDLFLNYENLTQSLQNEQSARYSADQNLENSKQKKVTVITITGNTTLSEIHNGAMLHITNSCTLTFAANLGKDFNFVEKAFGSIVVQHVAASGVTLNSDSGLILKNGAMGSVYAPSDDNFILTGTYTTS